MQTGESSIQVCLFGSQQSGAVFGDDQKIKQKSLVRKGHLVLGYLSLRSKQLLVSGHLSSSDQRVLRRIQDSQAVEQSRTGDKAEGSD